MINPWEDLFNTWIKALGNNGEEMKKYEVTLVTHATTTIFVDATNEDDAIDMAYDYLDPKDIELGEWEVENVDIGYDD